MAYIGYARVSTDDQVLDSQLDALKGRGCTKVFEEKESGRKAERPVLAKCLDYMREGDCLVIIKLDRLARSMRDLIEIVETLKKRGIDFMSINDHIETTTPQGKFFFHITGAVAELEADLIRERTCAGLAAARARGRVGGRKAKMTPEKIEAARKLLRDSTPPQEVAKLLGVARSTLYRHIPGAQIIARSEAS